MDKRVLLGYFGIRLEEQIPLASLTTSRTGGNARYYVAARTADELAEDVQFIWSTGFPLFIIANGSNILVSDQGIDAVVIHNRSKAIEVVLDSENPTIKAESGANLTTIARTAAQHSLTGLEWASTIPGSLGGAVYGNAGAHGADMASNLILANILHRQKGILSLSREQMEYSYRSSCLKRNPGDSVILSAQLAAQKGDQVAINQKMEENSEKRRRTQPPGASMGSTFKNPPGDYAGRLIEASGLKGMTIGGAQVSPVHANFLINLGTAKAQDYFDLITLVKKTVKEKSGVELELEIELVGNWQAKNG